MITPQLRKLIDDINEKDRKRVVFRYKDGYIVGLNVNEKQIVLDSDNTKLLQTLGNLLEKVLSGEAKIIVKKKGIDKKKK